MVRSCNLPNYIRAWERPRKKFPGSVNMCLATNADFCHLRRQALLQTESQIVDCRKVTVALGQLSPQTLHFELQQRHLPFGNVAGILSVIDRWLDRFTMYVIACRPKCTEPHRKTHECMQQSSMCGLSPEHTT